MLKITILDDSNPEVKQTKAGPMLKQRVWVHLPDYAFPKETQVTQWTDRETGELPKPYPKGEYTFGPDSFSIRGQYNDLVCDPKLVPYKPKAV